MCLKQEMINHIALCDNSLNFKLFTEKTLVEWFEPLINSFSEKGSVSYLIAVNERYRASPLASALDWLNEADLLSVNTINILKERLLFLRDNNESFDSAQGNTRKSKADSKGWSLGEGVSIWSTSVSLIALLDKKNPYLNNSDTIKDSIMWLVDQQNPTFNGWAYQNIQNCDVNVICTALALRALAKALKFSDYITFTEEEKHRLITSLNSGFTYIKDNITAKNNKHSYWTFMGNPNCAATTWALYSLFEAIELSDGIIKKDFIDFYNNVKPKAIDFILSKIPREQTKWEDEPIVHEAGAKYNKQKNYYSFSPTLLLQLFQLGLSPYHPKVINQIKWLIENPTLWKITSYDKGSVCSFTYAMVLATIAQWAKYVGIINSALLLKTPNKKTEKVFTFIFGYNQSFDYPQQLILNGKLLKGIIIILLILILFLLKEPIYFAIQESVVLVSSFIVKEANDIFVNIISSLIYLLICTIPIWIIKFIKWLRGKYNGK